MYYIVCPKFVSKPSDKISKNDLSKQNWTKKNQNKYKDTHTGQKSILWKFGVQTFYQCVVHFSNEYL